MKTTERSLRVEKAQCKDIPRVIELMRELAEFEELLVGYVENRNFIKHRELSRWMIGLFIE